ncbi:NAD-dependent epimerase/dehydratase family protein [candidate division KSB3 bacterium]|uniref:NAD-dependent epimerase/dehydratase family protein n=1 Tax=candidate division KSB3 bacterium TaxID=2044937 RepID=A0A9D5K000_9BACT|nr:NAD-dependent epimerase/dehydratase family protein [candidate division KSB3 bacterium]MBD3327125.1 NAD-dependent epimerase/dehydratase family protein [candidate division KSB3 bacterium]
MAEHHVLVTGSNGLIGSEAVLFFHNMGWRISGIDNNMRRSFFGDHGDTSWMQNRLIQAAQNFTHYDLDIRDRESMMNFFKHHDFDLIIHCAAQPSHDLAATRALEDFDVNAVGTVNLLEAYRKHCAEAVFIHMSTNKVYGDAPNRLNLVELETRWDYADEQYYGGIGEHFPIDQSTHSLFGASKVAADIMAQEYGRYFGLKVGVFRGGCLTGVNHSGVELHGFLNYLVRVALTNKPYTIFGYKGKQVRDQIHSHDVASLFYEFYKHPRCGEVYNVGGGRANSASVLECIGMIRQITGKQIDYTYTDSNRKGDHICYISNLQKISSHFPNWTMKYSLTDIITEMAHELPKYMANFS